MSGWKMVYGNYVGIQCPRVFCEKGRYIKVSLKPQILSKQTRLCPSFEYYLLEIKMLLELHTCTFEMQWLFL